MRVAGACHCGSIAFELDTRADAAAIAPRACDCSFCTRHGARTYTDADGSVTFRVAAGAPLVRYRFGARTADFLVCGRCGVYVGAVIEDGDALKATVNLRTTPLCELAATAVSYGRETRDERIARRRARWTPARIEVSG
jgi:hypothetical protein